MIKSYNTIIDSFLTHVINLTPSDRHINCNFILKKLKNMNITSSKLFDKFFNCMFYQTINDGYISNSLRFLEICLNYMNEMILTKHCIKLLKKLYSIIAQLSKDNSDLYLYSLDITTSFYIYISQFSNIKTMVLQSSIGIGPFINIYIEEIKNIHHKDLIYIKNIYQNLNSLIMKYSAFFRVHYQILYQETMNYY